MVKGKVLMTKEHLALFNSGEMELEIVIDLDGRKSYGFPAAFFADKGEDLELVAKEEAEELMRQKQEEKTKREKALAEKK